MPGISLHVHWPPISQAETKFHKIDSWPPPNLDSPRVAGREVPKLNPGEAVLSAARSDSILKQLIFSKGNNDTIARILYIFFLEFKVVI
jgi:hypothetical protein